MGTLLGTPLAGTVLIALNARARGRSPARPAALGLVLSATLLALAATYPFLRTGLVLGSVVLMGLWARAEGAEEGEPGSWGIVAGAAFVGFVAMLAIVLPSALS